MVIFVAASGLVSWSFSLNGKSEMPLLSVQLRKGGSKKSGAKNDSHGN